MEDLNELKSYSILVEEIHTMLFNIRARNFSEAKSKVIQMAKSGKVDQTLVHGKRFETEWLK